MATTEQPSKGFTFKPGIMQWVIGALLILGLVISGVSAGSFGPGRIVALLLMAGTWGYWVWRQPDGGRGLIIPLLAVLSAFLAGALMIILFAGQDTSFIDRLALAVRGYAAMVDGSLLKTNALTNTLVASTPLILMGLAVALAFRAGLFNIGAEGQFMVGSICAAFIGYALPLPPVLHAIVALLGGTLGGALWGAIPGVLKARLGAHEVINTIMLNWIAIFMADWLVNGPMRDTSGASSTIRTPYILPGANLPIFSEILPGLFPRGDRLHLGFVIALILTVAVWWLLWKTTVGFELRTTGSNPDAARYAGIRAGWTTVLAMGLSGALAGLAGAIEIQGVSRYMPAFFQAGYGFDAIAVALLSSNHPIAVIPSAIIFGALRVGSDVLQIRTGVSRHMVSVIQALILLFVAAPAMVRWIYRLRLPKGELEEVPLTRGWGS